MRKWEKKMRETQMTEMMQTNRCMINSIVILTMKNSMIRMTPVFKI